MAIFHIQKIEYYSTNDLLDEIGSLIQTSKPVMQLLDRKKRLYMLHSKRLWTALQIDLIKTSRKVKAAAVLMKNVFFFEKFSALQVLTKTSFRMRKFPFDMKVRWWNFSFKIINYTGFTLVYSLWKQSRIL